MVSFVIQKAYLMAPGNSLILFLLFYLWSHCFNHTVGSFFLFFKYATHTLPGGFCTCWSLWWNAVCPEVCMHASLTSYRSSLSHLNKAFLRPFKLLTPFLQWLFLTSIDELFFLVSIYQYLKYYAFVFILLNGRFYIRMQTSYLGQISGGFWKVFLFLFVCFVSLEPRIVPGML